MSYPDNPILRGRRGADVRYLMQSVIEANSMMHKSTRVAPVASVRHDPPNLLSRLFTLEELGVMHQWNESGENLVKIKAKVKPIDVRQQRAGVHVVLIGGAHSVRDRVGNTYRCTRCGRVHALVRDHYMSAEMFLLNGYRDSRKEGYLGVRVNIRKDENYQKCESALKNEN